MNNVQIPKGHVGIYAIVCKSTNHKYVGRSGVCVRGRNVRHVWALRRNVHPCEHLQNAWSKYGEDDFDFILVEACLRSECVLREQHHIDLAWHTGTLFNATQSAEAGPGMHTPETRARIAAKKRGKKITEEHRLNIAKSKTGIKASADTKAKMSASRIGKKHSSETLAKMSESNSGKVRSPETLQRMSTAAKNMSAEARAKLSVAAIAQHAARRLAKAALP